jgi:probable O-glycosylation ligase (exosortase A-associated)
MPLRGILLLLFFIPSLPICFFRPFYGIILWIIVAFLNPQSYTWQAFDVFPWAAAVAVATILGMVMSSETKWNRLVSSQAGALAALWAWFAITTLISINSSAFEHHSLDTLVKLKFVSKVLLMTFCMLPIVTTFERLRIVLLTIAGCFGFYILKSFPFLILTGGVYRLYGPERSMIADNNDFGLALNMTLPLYFYLAQTESKPWVKRLMAVLFILTIPAVFFTYSRGALVGLAALLGMMLLQSRRRLAIVPVLALGVVIGVYFAPEGWQERMNPNRPDAIDASARSRLNAWAYASALAADYPIAGGGFATFTPELFAKYAPTMVFGGGAYTAHSVYFQILAEHGYVGLGLYLFMILLCFKTIRRLRKQSRIHDPVIAQYAHALQFSLIGFMACGVFLSQAYFDYFFTIVACVAVLDHAAAERRARAPLPDPIQANAYAA